MRNRKSRPLLIFYILVAYVLIQFGWWSYLLISQYNELYSLKQHINLFEHHDPQLIIEKGNELEKKLLYKWIMIIGEGLVFAALLVIAFIRVQKTFKAEEQLVAQQKNFIHSVTHELKSPITSAKLAMETLFKHNLDRGKQIEVISNAIADTDRLNTLVENLLLAAKIDNTQFQVHLENINLSTYMEMIIKQATSTFQCKQNIISNIQPNLFFNIDKTIFPSIFLNLFENAAKYSSKSATITITLKEQGNGVILALADEGIGIQKEEEENIFKQFYRIGNEETRKTKGTGLGLYIVKYLVKKHNGIITVRKNAPQGAIFEVMLINPNDYTI